MGWGGCTGVSSSGVEMGEQSPFSLMPLPRSKSQIFTGDTFMEGGGHRCVGLDEPYGTVPPTLTPLTWSGLSHRMFSGFRSLCAIPIGVEEGGGGRTNRGTLI